MTQPQKTQLPTKKTKMLQAARAVMIEQGFSQTTVSRVAEVAGVSRGLLHYHFANKEQMLAEVLRLGIGDALERFEARIENCQTLESFSNGLAVSYQELFQSDPAIFKLFVEGLVAAQNSTAVHNELLSQSQAFEEAVKRAIRRIRGKHTSDDDLYCPATLQLTALMDGFACKLATSPQVAEREEFWQILERGVLKLLR